METVQKSKEQSDASSAASNIPLSLHLETLYDALKHFDLLSQLDDLDKSIEDLRRFRKSEKDHKLRFEKFIKEVHKLSFKYHPDKIEFRGSSKEIAENEKLQIAINAIRKTLSFLDKIFLDDPYTDYKYTLYLRLNISSLGSENKMKPYVEEISFKIKFISVIRRQQVIAEIRRFLTESKSCIKSYIEKEDEGFEKHFSSALSHADKCIEGYKGLIEEYDLIEEDLTTEGLHSPIVEMKKRDSEQMKSLEHLKNLAKLSLEGHFLTLNDLIEVCLLEGYSADEYFVLPFVCNINLMIMCKKMKETETESLWWGISRRLFSKFKFKIPCEYFVPPESISGNEDAFFHLAYYLALYYRGYCQYKNVVMKIMKKEDANPKEIKARFLTYVEQISVFLENKFNIRYYAI